MRSSSVLAFPPPSAAESAEWLRAKLAWYTDAWDLAEDLSHGDSRIVAIDTRSEEAYRAGHICGAISFPHRSMTAKTLAGLDSSKVYITYCDGIGCNGSTKGAWKLASAGFRVKELIGELDFWRRDGHPIAQGETCGNWPPQSALTGCGC